MACAAYSTPHAHPSRPCARSTVLHAARLDDIDADLLVSAARITGNNAAFIYDFAMRDTQRSYLNGRATVLLDPNFSRATGR